MKNNWFQTNVTKVDREDFKIILDPYPFRPQFLWDASIQCAKDLLDENTDLLVAYSGGMDSEYVLKVFVDSGLPITPVIVRTPLNPIEIQYAFKFCKDRGLKPVILDLTFHEYMDYVIENAYKKFQWIGPYGIHSMIIADRLKKPVVSGYGDPFKCDDFTQALSTTLEFSEWDYYYADPNLKPISFFSHTQEVFYALITQMDYSLPLQEAKSKIYDLPFRPKILGEFNRYQTIVLEIQGHYLTRTSSPRCWIEKAELKSQLSKFITE
jgi:hypothetical protein